MIPETIQALTAQLARDPGSLVFLPLAEALRRRGQLDAALTVANAGAARYPEMAGAYDLIARIQSDRGEGDLAFDAWTTVLGSTPITWARTRAWPFSATGGEIMPGASGTCSAPPSWRPTTRPSPPRWRG